MAWLSPVNVKHQQYRQAVLEFEIEPKDCGTKRVPLQPPDAVISRGTILHHYYDGKSAVDVSAGLAITINCREQAGKLDDEVPYALVVSFEVEANSQIDVYEAVRQKLALRLQQPVQV